MINFWNIKNYLYLLLLVPFNYCFFLITTSINKVFYFTDLDQNGLLIFSSIPLSLALKLGAGAGIVFALFFVILPFGLFCFSKKLFPLLRAQLIIIFAILFFVYDFALSLLEYETSFENVIYCYLASLTMILWILCLVLILLILDTNENALDNSCYLKKIHARSKRENQETL